MLLNFTAPCLERSILTLWIYTLITLYVFKVQLKQRFFGQKALISDLVSMWLGAGDAPELVPIVSMEGTCVFHKSQYWLISVYGPEASHHMQAQGLWVEATNPSIRSVHAISHPGQPTAV